jgi:hypothetical protein
MKQETAEALFGIILLLSNGPNRREYLVPLPSKALNGRLNQLLGAVLVGVCWGKASEDRLKELSLSLGSKYGRDIAAVCRG